jgi:signal transduction histidine kinase
MKRYRSIHTSVAWWMLLLLAVILVVVYGSGWYLLQLVKESKERDLGLRMLSIGQTAAMQLERANWSLEDFADADGNVDPELLATYSESPALKDLRAWLLRLKDQNDLHTVMIVNANNQILIDAEGKYAAGEQFPFLEIDQVEIENAQAGTPSTSPLYRVRDFPYKRSYTPLLGRGNRVLGLLRLEASRDYFEELVGLKHRLYWLGLVCALLLASAGVLFYRLLKHLIRAEEAIAFTDRLQSLGTLAAGLAHELRNPLGIILATSEGLRDELPEKGEQRQLVTDIIQECQRLNTLIAQFLAFAQPVKPAEAQPFQITSAVESVLGLLRKDLEKKQIAIQTSYQEPLPLLQMDEKSVRQVLLNLLLNAKDAIDSGGRISVRVERKRRWVSIEINDNGRGIPQRDLKAIYEPFFTTKPEGTGLGLFISRTIVERSGGKIDISSEPGKGTTAVVMFPC